MKGRRKNWIDWMKVISMLFIVWGHMFPDRMTNFVYTFNVPVFFVISGLLDTNGWVGYNLLIFSKKQWGGLMLPYLVICLTSLTISLPLLYMTGDLSITNCVRSIGYIGAGFQSCPHGVGAAAMWFVYTLLFIKIVFWIVKDWRWLGMVTGFCIVGAIMCQGHSLAWSVQNVLLALPFYYVGWLLANNVKQWFENLTARIKAISQKYVAGTWASICIGALILYVIGEHNGLAKMYACSYGNSIVLFFIGGLLGSALIYIASLCLDDLVFPWVRTISIGSIVILGYQFIPIKIYGFVMQMDHLSPFKNNDMITLAVSILIMWMFIYIIKFMGQYFPVVLGGRKID